MNTVDVQELTIHATDQTPEVLLLPSGHLKISGRSMRPNIEEFPSIDQWISKYLNNPAEITVVDFDLEYLHARVINRYISLLKRMTVPVKGRKLIINWYYEDGDLDILEKGEDISSALSQNVRFIKKPS